MTGPAPLRQSKTLVHPADVLARAIRNGQEHDGSDCDHAVDQDARRYVERLAEYGYAIVGHFDVLRLVQEATQAQSALRAARHAMCDAHVLLSPGMRAGTGEAKAKLAAAIEVANAALGTEA